MFLSVFFFLSPEGRRNFQVLRSKRPIRTSATITTSSTPSNFPVNENNLPEAEKDAKEQTKEAKLMQSDGTRRPSHKRAKPRDSLRPTYWTQKNTGQKHSDKTRLPNCSLVPGFRSGKANDFYSTIERTLNLIALFKCGSLFFLESCTFLCFFVKNESFSELFLQKCFRLCVIHGNQLTV